MRDHLPNRAGGIPPVFGTAVRSACSSTRRLAVKPDGPAACCEAFAAVGGWKPIAMLNGEVISKRRVANVAAAPRSRRLQSVSHPIRCRPAPPVADRRRVVDFRRAPFSDPALGGVDRARSGLHRDPSVQTVARRRLRPPVGCMSLRVHGRQSASLAGFWSLDGPRGRDTARAYAFLGAAADAMDRIQSVCPGRDLGGG